MSGTRGRLGTAGRVSPEVCPHRGFVLPPPGPCQGQSWCLGAPGAHSPPNTPGVGQHRAVPTEAGGAPPLPTASGVGGTPAPLQTVATHGPHHPRPRAGERQGEGLQPRWQDDAVARGSCRLGWPGRAHGQDRTDRGTSPLPRIRLSARGRLGTAHWGKAHQDVERLLPFLPPTPSAWYPTPGSPRGYLTPSLGSGFLGAGGRSTASHIPKETVGSFEKVGLALGCLFIAPRAQRSHASVPQRSCTGLFIFPLPCFPLAVLPRNAAGMADMGKLRRVRDEAAAS